MDFGPLLFRQVGMEVVGVVGMSVLVRDCLVSVKVGMVFLGQQKHPGGHQQERSGKFSRYRLT
jgi:hypothetical protein